MQEERQPDITVVSDKGQVVIPQSIREKLGIKPRTKLLVYGYDDVVIMKRLDIPDVIQDLKQLYKKIDKKIAKYGQLSEEDIEYLVQKQRKHRS